MPPHEGLTHLKEYDIKDSNVELIGTEIDHRVKYNSAKTEPAWNDGKVGLQAGLHVWRIEDFEVIPWPKEKYGQFFDGDSYIVLHSYKVGKDGNEKLGHEIFFWLGSKTSQDEAGTAAYKTVELDEFLQGSATQHREIQQQPSDEFVALFPRLSIRAGGVRSGFTHVETDAKTKEVTLLLRIFKHPSAVGRDSIIVHEVEPTWQSLDEEDVFVLDKGDKIWVWQGKKCSPMEKAKAAQVVNDLTLAKHVDVEVLAQTDSRSHVYPPQQHQALAPADYFALVMHLDNYLSTLSKKGRQSEERILTLMTFFLLDVGRTIWVWKGLGASAGERAMWLNVAQSYVRQLQGTSDAYLIPLAAVIEGNESPSFLKAIEA
ncbi:Severin [Lachnellula subtilissima]|uniref:Severin n=1 Tax=Lachnellula subtilissima TaxID=602034 RepID=A0A8H8RW35_9HELO|nr:Severin [Lachnellula subtilissima]